MEMLEEILDELKIELDVTEDSDIAILTSKIKSAIREVKRARNYGNRFDDEWVTSDLENYYTNIKDLAMYDYVTVGGEFEKTHDENGINRSWQDRNECLNGVVSIATCV